MAKQKREIVIRFRENRGKWEVDCRAVRGWVPRRPLFDTEETAYAYANRVLQERGLISVSAEDRTLTLREYAERRLVVWRLQLAARTVRGYEQCLTLHILPRFGGQPVREIRRQEVKAFLEVKLSETYMRRWPLRGEGVQDDLGRPYTKNYIRLIRATLSTLLTDAVDDGLLTANPLLALGRKTRRGPGVLTKADRTEKIRPLSRDERDRLLLAAEAEPRYVVLFHVLAKAGLRPSEAFALRPDDVDLVARTVRVERALDLRGQVKDIKTSEARTVDLTPEVTALLRRHLTRAKADALRRGWGEVMWLFPNEENRPLDEAKARKAFKRALTRAGLPACRVYDLRHTYAGLLLAAGAPLTYVSAQLGHATPDTTLRHYARWIPSKGERWVNTLDSGTKSWNQSGVSQENASEVPEKTGAGGGI